MPSRPANAGWGNVKSKLAELDAAALVALLRDLYQASPENRRFLHGRFLGSQAEQENYRRLIADAVYPDPLSRNPVRLGEAERLIRHFQRATADRAATVDLMLTFVEAGTEQAAGLGYGDERYFAALERTLKATVDELPGLPLPVQAEAAERVRKLVRRAAVVGWGYGDAVEEIATALPTVTPESARASRAAVAPPRLRRNVRK